MKTQPDGIQGNRLWLRKWSFVLLNLVVFSVMVKLGFWQLERAEEKRKIVQISQQSEQHERTFNDLFRLSANQLHLSRVKINGRFDVSQVFLLDNQMWQGKVGYQVILPVIQKQQAEQARQAVLVNLGWIPAPVFRDVLPELPTQPVLLNALTLTGRVKQVDLPLLLEQEPLPEGWPKRIQALEMDKLIAYYYRNGIQLASSVVLLDESLPYGFERRWLLYAMPPEKHLAYAVQWFLMAAVQLALFIWLVMFWNRKAGRQIHGS